MMNHSEFLGNLVADPVGRKSQKGNDVARFTVAVSGRKNAEGKQTPTYVPVVAFGKQATSVLGFKHKGDLVLVEGRLNTNAWVSKEGQKRSRMEIVAESVTFLTRGRKVDPATPTEGATSESEQAEIEFDAGLPEA